jgi:hypothetical protein
LQLNALSVADKLKFQKLRPAIPAQASHTMDEASAPESNLCGCKIQPALPKIPRLFQNGNHRNVRLR